MLVFLCASLLFAQQNNTPLIKFQKTVHDFGQIKEDGGLAEYSFEFTNITNKPIKLSNVQASCGCTTPIWTKDQIPSGKTGVVKAAYDPMNRVGTFDKTITVMVEGQSSPIILTIKGNVIARVKGIKDFYPMEIGSLRFSSYNFYFEKIFHDGQASKKMTIYNQGSKPVKLFLNETKKTLQPHITFTAEKDVVNPKDSIKIEVNFDASKQKEWDYVFSTIQLHTDDETMDKENKPTKIKNIYVNAKVVENFGNLTNETKLPVAKFDRNTHNFGNVKQTPDNKTSFTLTNNGQADLIIRQSKASCGCTLAKLEKDVLKPGESTKFEVQFSTLGKPAGPQTQTVTVITNDPANPRTELRIEANVVTEEPKK